MVLVEILSPSTSPVDHKEELPVYQQMDIPEGLVLVQSQGTMDE